MPEQIRAIATIHSVSIPPPLKGQSRQKRIVLNLPLGLLSDEMAAALDRNVQNQVEITMTLLQIELPEAEPEPTEMPQRRRRRGNGNTPPDTESLPDPADIAHAYQAPRSQPGGDCTVCGNGPNADIHAEVSSVARALIDSIGEGDAN